MPTKQELQNQLDALVQQLADVQGQLEQARGEHEENQHLFTERAYIMAMAPELPMPAAAAASITSPRRLYRRSAPTKSSNSLWNL